MKKIKYKTVFLSTLFIALIFFIDGFLIPLIINSKLPLWLMFFSITFSIFFTVCATIIFVNMATVELIQKRLW